MRCNMHTRDDFRQLHAMQYAYYICISCDAICIPEMTSTNFITGTGFMKCIPTTLAGLGTCAVRVQRECRVCAGHAYVC